MKCSNCGTVLRKDSVFCHKCGTRVEAVPEDVTGAAEADVAGEDLTADENKETPAADALTQTEEASEAGRDASDDSLQSADERFDEYFKPDEEEPRKKKGFIIGAAVAVAAVCLICFCCSRLSRLFKNSYFFIIIFFLSIFSLCISIFLYCV